MKPRIEIVGAEAALYPSVWNALRGENRPLGGPTLAEGIAVKNVGKLTLPIIRELVAEIILVDEAQLERAVNAYLTLAKDHGGRRRRRRSCRDAGEARAVSRQEGRACSVRRQHRSAHSRLDHGARA